MSEDFPTQQMPDSANSPYQTMSYIVERMISRISTATLVKVQKCTNSGEVKEVGQLDATPLVNMQDGIGTNFQHGTLHNLIYFRYQSGDNAVIMDPKPGDIGIAIFADRDISVVKKKKDQAQPGSYRRFDMADGMYIPSMLGGMPKNYVRFYDQGIIGNFATMQWVLMQNFAQIKSKGDSTLHVTIDKGSGEIILGKDYIVGPDPNPNT